MVTRCVCLVGLMLGIFTVPTVEAATLEDFEGLNIDLLDGQGAWYAATNVRVIRDENTENRLMRLVGSDANAYLPLDASAILDNQVGTLFFRFQVDGNGVDHTLGLSDVTAPTTWGDYETTTRIYPDSFGDVQAQGRNDGNYDDMTLNGGADSLTADTWYHMWMVNDNTADTVDFYIQGGHITTQRLVAENYGFRNGTTDPLSTFMARTGASATSNVYIDDIHAWAGQNLTSPIGEPDTGIVAPDDGIIPVERTLIGLDFPTLFTFIGDRVTNTDSTMPADRMPERTYSGYWNETNAWAWTSGFYAGQMWKMYRQTGDTYYLNAAKARTAALEGQELNGGDHDVGFRVFNSFGEGYKSLPDGDPDKADYLSRILVAADTLAGRYNSTYEAIASWGSSTVIIDNMMNLELLFWAAENTADPIQAQTWYDIAVNHAITSQREHVRPDGSTYHVVEFDLGTGDVIDKRTAQGYDDESTWSRGQSWGLYGFTQTYRFTDNASFLDTAVALADYWIDNMPADGFVPYDFDDPAPDVPLDSSAMAIASSAMLELMGYLDPSEAARYFNAAELMLSNLASLDLLTNGLEYESILMEGSIADNYHHMGLTYGDYYFIEALQRYVDVINTLPGDINMDGFVGIEDLNIVLSNWNQDVPLGMVQYGDLVRDGFIGIEDLNIVLSNWNAGSPPSVTSIPEPGAMMFMFVSMLPLISWRRGV